MKLKDIVFLFKYTIFAIKLLRFSSYVLGNHTRYGVEGKVCLAWRDEVWDKGYQILTMFEFENQPIPTINEFISQLPKIVWPNIS